LFTSKFLILNWASVSRISRSRVFAFSHIARCLFFSLFLLPPKKNCPTLLSTHCI
jgi:hypothetical protein